MKKLLILCLFLTSPSFAKCIDNFKYGQIYRQECEFCDYMTITKINEINNTIEFKQFAYENNRDKNELIITKTKNACEVYTEYTLIFELPSKEKALYMLNIYDVDGVLIVNNWNYMLRLFGEQIQYEYNKRNNYPQNLANSELNEKQEIINDRKEELNNLNNQFKSILGSFKINKKYTDDVNYIQKRLNQQKDELIKIVNECKDKCVYSSNIDFQTTNDTIQDSIDNLRYELIEDNLKYIK